MALLRPLPAKVEARHRQNTRMSMLEAAQPIPDPVYVPLFGRITAQVLCGEDARDEHGPFVQYIIMVKYEGKEWQVARRFSTFEKLHAMLQSNSSSRKQRLPDLPKKHMLWRGLDREYVKTKAGKLDTYLRGVMQMQPCADSPEMYNFLFKNRYTVGVRASFIGVPEAAPSGALDMPQPKASNLTASVDSFCEANSYNNSYNNSFGDSLSMSPTANRDALEANMLQQLAPKGSALADFLEMNAAEIREHEQCIADLKAEREARIKKALKEHGSSLAASPTSPPLSAVEQPPGVLDYGSVIEKHFSEPQDIDCSAYGTTQAAVDALKRGFILVTFPSKGTELSVQLAEPITSASATTELSGTAVLDGATTVFQGSLRLAELKGAGSLRLSAPARDAF